MTPFISSLHEQHLNIQSLLVASGVVGMLLVEGLGSIYCAVWGQNYMLAVAEKTRSSPPAKHGAGQSSVKHLAFTVYYRIPMEGSAYSTKRLF